MGASRFEPIGDRCSVASGIHYSVQYKCIRCSHHHCRRCVKCPLCPCAAYKPTKERLWNAGDDRRSAQGLPLIPF